MKATNSRLEASLLLILAVAGIAAGSSRELAAETLEPAAPTEYFERLTSADGLPHDVVYSLLQDRTGFLWLATEGGLARYDGYTVTSFFHHPLDPSSLAANDVSQILEDRDGTLWIATWGGGLDRLDPRTDHIVHVGGGAGDPGGLRDQRVQSLYQDREGTLWVGTFAGGLHRLDGPTLRPRPGRPHPGRPAAGGPLASYSHDPADPTSLSHDRVWSIRQDPLGFLWVATADGLSLLDPESGDFQVFRHRPEEATSLSHSSVRALHIDSAGNLWVGTEGGLDRFHRPTKTFERVALGTPEVGRSPVNAILEDRRGALWIGTAGGGLVRLDRESGDVRRFLHHPSALHSLGDNDVRALWEDRSGILWVGTRGGGLSKLNLSPRSFHQFSEHGGASGLTSPRVQALAEDRAGRLWVGTASGLNRYDRDRRGLVHFRHDPADPASLADDHIHRLLVDRGGELWVATRRGGLSRFVGDREGFAHYRHDPRDSTSLVGDETTELYQDQAGDLWVGTLHGLDRLDRASSSCEHFRHDPDDQSSLSEGYVRAIAEDGEGDLWVGTDSAGLNRLDRDSGSFERFIHVSRDPLSLSDNRVNALFLQGSRQSSGPAGSGPPGSGPPGSGLPGSGHPGESYALWIATARGLNQLLPGSGPPGSGLPGSGLPGSGLPGSGHPGPRFRRYLETDGLADAHVLGVVDDGRGRLWLSTQAGLSRLDPQTGEIRNYGARDGIERQRFARGAGLESREGRLYFGGDAGLITFDPHDIVDDSVVPAVVLTAVRRFDEVLDLGVVPAAAETIELSWEDTYLTFEFAALDFVSPRENRYRYLLEGFDRDWIDAGERRQASYNHLPPGRFTFRVRAATSAGVWNEEGLAVPVVISPPLWKTAWFRLGLALAILAVAGLAYRLRIGQLKRRERELGRRVEEGLEERRKSDERYRLLFERNLAGVVRSTVDGRILDCNRAFARLLGFASGDDCLDQQMLSGEDHERFLQTLREEGQVVSFEYSLEARDGSPVPLLWNAHLLVEEGGELVIEGTVIDISERRRMEEGLLRSQKLESLALLAGGIAHDFNNLLTAILGHAELARGELAPASGARDRLDQIEQAAERAASLSKQMLAYSGKGSFLTAALDVSAAVDELAPLLEGAVSDQVALTYELAHDLPAVDADGSQLSQVLLSLVTNAAEAIGDGESEDSSDRGGGTITVSTGVVSCDRDYLSGTFLDDELEEGDYVFLEVTDDGCGMDAETQRKIFDPFFTTKFAGRGLGLAAVLGIIRGHRGAIEIDSEPGEGTTIRVLFPVDRRPRAASAAVSADDESWRGSGTLLLVDDEPQVRTVGEEMAKLLGFEVLAAADGPQGIEIFRRHDEIALVVLDLAMPQMNGAEAYLEMRRIRSDVPVLLATGYDEQETMERLADRGFAGFIQKPYRLSVLRRKLRDALEAGRPARVGAS